MWLVDRYDSLNTLAYPKKPSLLNSFLFPGVKEERARACSEIPVILMVNSCRNRLPCQCHADGLRGWGWRLASLPACAATCGATALFSSPCESRTSQSKDGFPFFTSLNFFFLFFHYLQSTVPHLLPVLASLALRQFFPYFFSTIFAATTFLALFLIQPKAYSPSPRSPRKSCPFYLIFIWSPLAVHLPASEGGGK